jgi:hypothetical protein
MPPKRSQRSPDPEEETPLLRDTNPLPKETPLPITQILVLLLLQLTEPITSSSIRPYINQVRSLILITKIVSDVRLSLSVNFQSLVVMKGRSDITPGY